MAKAVSEFDKYRRAYGTPGQGISPEMAWQHTQRLAAGADVVAGKYGTGLPQLLGVGPDGAPTGGGGGGGLGDQYQSAADAAAAATNGRDREIRGILDARQQGAKDLFARTSGGMYSNIYRNQQRRIGAARMNDAARGLFRSGAGNTKTEQLDRREEMTQAEGEVAQKQALLDASLAKDKADYVERITDQGPDMNQLIGLEQQMGSGNMAGMGGGSNLYGGGEQQMPQGGVVGSDGRTNVGANGLTPQEMTIYGQGGAPQGGYQRAYGGSKRRAGEMGPPVTVAPGVAPMAYPSPTVATLPKPQMPVINTPRPMPPSQATIPQVPVTIAPPMTTPPAAAAMERQFMGSVGSKRRRYSNIYANA